MNTTNVTMVIEPFPYFSLIPYDPSVVAGISGQVDNASWSAPCKEIDMPGQVTWRVNDYVND